ncbi:MAG: alkaline phosphatase family protein [Myxococcota bacterium]
MVSETLVNSIIDSPADDSTLLQDIPRLKRYLYTVRWSLASALTNTAIVTSQLQQQSFDLVLTYFDGTDTLAHRFWLLRQPLEEIRARLGSQGMNPALAGELKQRMGNAIDNFYAFIDQQLDRIWRAAGPNATIIVVSDHGWGPLRAVKAPYEHVPFDGQHEIEGVFLAAGPAIRHHSIAPLSLYDIAPTVLYAVALVFCGASGGSR